MVNFLLKQGANVNAKTKVKYMYSFLFAISKWFGHMDTSVAHHSYKHIFFLVLLK